MLNGMFGRLLRAVLGITLFAAVEVGVFAAPAHNTPGFVNHATDLGPMDAGSVLNVNVWLNLHNQRQLDRLAEQQHQPRSSNYRHWITQDQFNAAYAPTAQEVNAVSNFLTAKGLRITAVAENNLYVTVQGTVAELQNALGVQLRRYLFKGQVHRSNSADPSINGAAGGLIAAITGLDDYGFQPNVVRAHSADGAPAAMRPLAANPDGLFFEGQCFRSVESHTFTSDSATGVYTGNRYGSDIDNAALGHLPPCGYQPSELQTAYGLTSLHDDGFDGTGETIVITDAYGSPTIAQDAQLFSEVYGLPPVDLVVMRAPGLVNSPKMPGWDAETTLDVEWAHAMAPGARIVLVTATASASLDEAINYAVVHHLGNTISNSWSTVEGFGNPAQFDRINRILEMAAVQGIDVNFASGDDGDEFLQYGFETVDFPASSPYATGVGGTSLGLNADQSIAFQSGWGTNLTRLADRATLGSPPDDPPLAEGFQFGAGGGASLTFARPAFQAALAAPGTARLVPDIAMLADPYTGVEIIQTVDGEPSVGVIGGTSLATPMFSGIMAIAAQKAGHPIGQAAALIYDLPSGAITDITPISSPGNVTGTLTDSGGTTVLGADALAAPLENTSSYLSAFYNSPFSTRWFVLTFGTDSSLTTAPGWDNVTGVGTPNGAAFVNAIAQ